MTLHIRNAIRIRPDNLQSVALALRRIGFRDPIFQEWRIGQRFGLSRPLTNLLEWHIRGFADGSLDSEVEISRKRFLHVAGRPGSYYTPLLSILRQNGIPFNTQSALPPDANYIYYPEPFGRTIAVQVPGSH